MEQPEAVESALGESAKKQRFSGQKRAFLTQKRAVSGQKRAKNEGLSLLISNEREFVSCSFLITCRKGRRKIWLKCAGGGGGGAFFYPVFDLCNTLDCLSSMRQWVVIIGKGQWTVFSFQFSVVSCQFSVVSFQLEARGGSAGFPFCTIENGLFYWLKNLDFFLKNPDFGRKNRENQPFSTTRNRARRRLVDHLLSVSYRGFMANFVCAFVRVLRDFCGQWNSSKFDRQSVYFEPLADGKRIPFHATHRCKCQQSAGPACQGSWFPTHFTMGL